MRPWGKRITIELILGAACLASLVVLVRQSRRLAEYQRRLAMEERALKNSFDRLRQKELEATPPPAPIEEPDEATRAGLSRKEATIKRLDRELAQARGIITDLQSQLAAARDQNSKAQASANDRLQKEQTDARARMDDLQKKLDDALAQTDITRQRVTALEQDNAKLKTDGAAVAGRASQVAQITANLQDIESRREVYITSILRRYRDIGDQFRAMGGMLDTSRDGNSSPCGGALLGRIQTAVSSADDELRQVSELNARSQKLQKQLASK